MVHIYSQEGSLYVENKIQPRTVLKEGTKNGLLNLKKRYVLLLNKEVKVHTENNIFAVELPLVKRP